MAIDRNITVDFELHERQRRIWNDPARFRVVAAGRRFGKSWLGCAMCFDVALHGGRAWWVAPSYPMSNVGWRGLAQIRAQLPGVGIDLRRGERSFAFPGGGEVRVKSADNPDSLRGEGLDFAVLDECAYMKREAWTEALRPALSDRKGGGALHFDAARLELVPRPVAPGTTAGAKRMALVVIQDRGQSIH